MVVDVYGPEQLETLDVADHLRLGDSDILLLFGEFAVFLFFNHRNDEFLVLRNADFRLFLFGSSSTILSSQSAL